MDTDREYGFGILHQLASTQPALVMQTTHCTVIQQQVQVITT